MNIESKPADRKPDRRLARTRSALLRAGEQLFSQRSSDAVTIDEIILAADVARASFYNHFKDKDALAEAVIDAIRHENSELVAHHNANVVRAADRIARAVYVNCRYAAERRDRARLLRDFFFDITTHHLDRSRTVARNLFRDIEDGIAVGDFHDVRVDVGVMLVVGLTNIAVETVLAERADRQLVSGLVEGLLRSLGLPTDDAANVTKAAADDILSADTKRLLRISKQSATLHIADAV